mgnify:FL=1
MGSFYNFKRNNFYPERFRQNRHRNMGVRAYRAFRGGHLFLNLHIRVTKKNVAINDMNDHYYLVSLGIKPI